MNYLRWLLFPFSLLYGIVVSVRNWCYDVGIFKTQAFNIPVIAIGNLDAGGAGKTPMTEYLVRLLSPQCKVATLSRGYGRITTGWQMVTAGSKASEVGDEPLQLKIKYPHVTVAVCEDRVKGVKRLMHPNQVILLDDAYQHRAIIPGFNILLFDYNRLKGINLLLPAGNRREPLNGTKRADVIVITKCPPGLSEQQQEKMVKRAGVFPYQQVFFTSIIYQQIQDKNGIAAKTITNDTHVFLLTGIANPVPLYQYIIQFTPHITSYNYPDHHRFSLKNIAKLAAGFEACKADKKIIITTEKDMQRLGEQELLPLTSRLPFYTLPISVAFLNDGQEQFDQVVKNYVRQYTAYSSIH